MDLEVGWLWARVGFSEIESEALSPSVLALPPPQHLSSAPPSSAEVPLQTEPLAEGPGPIVSSNPCLQNPLEHFGKFLYTLENITESSFILSVVESAF